MTAVSSAGRICTRLVAYLTVPLAFMCVTTSGAGRIAESVPPDRGLSSRPWMNVALTADARAALLLQRMTLEEKVSLVHGKMGSARPGFAQPEGALGSAGYFPGVPRLGIPPLQETDGPHGVTNPHNVRPGDAATALPAAIALAATWDRALAYRSGALLGDESHRKGFNIMLGGGVNIAREPRNGRNFEYPGEDPLLAGVIAGESVRGIQDQHVAATLKHYALNNQESGRFSIDIRIAEAAARESDLLAFQFAVEIGKPASVMCAYNRVNGDYACENDWLLNQVLKRDWGYKGWVMSDWGAVHSTEAVLKGLDQESGEQLDREIYLGEPLIAKARSEPRYSARLDDMVSRILRSLIEVGVLDHPPVARPIDYAENAKAAQAVAEEGIVLLKNRSGVLPLRNIQSIAVIGGMAQFGVMSGGGSSYTSAIDGPGFQLPAMGISSIGLPRMMAYHPSSPVDALKQALPNVRIRMDGGAYPAAAVAAAKAVDVPVVFATQWQTESADVPNLSLPNGQDELIRAVAEANPNTVVVLETGGPVLMPWLDKVAAVVVAWYPGGRGGPAIANVLTGRVNPSGRLPVTFPANESQLPRLVVPGRELPSVSPKDGGPATPVRYEEGADIGYRWFARQSHEPLFPFGFGLSYSTFRYSNLKVQGGKTLRVSFTVRNEGEVAGSDVPQAYLTSLAGATELRLIGWEKFYLEPGQSREVAITADQRLLARFDESAHRWRIPSGKYQVSVGTSAQKHVLNGTARISGGTTQP